MILRVLGVLLLGVFVTSHSLAQSEEERRQSFYEQQIANKQFDQEREAGLKEYLKEQTEWEEQRKKDIQADKKRKKAEAPTEDSPEYRADRKEKHEDELEYEKLRKAYVKEKKSHEAKNAKEQVKREEWALEEYGLDKERPRFDIAKRNLYGGKPGGAKTGALSGSTLPGTAPSFPAPPAFDDFSDGYVPPPFPPAETFEPPPEGFPPPPPIPFPGEQGGDFDGGYFPPPPPPMPPPMDGDSF
jgi:hypothetical protein